MLNREYYLDKIKSVMWNGDIKVVTGIRRCGKSTLLFGIFYQYLLSTGVAEEQILRFALDQRRYYEFRNPIRLCDFVEEKVLGDKSRQYYLLIDEVQFTETVRDKKHGNIPVSIYDMLNELKAYPNLDVYVTGSNSKMLSSDIATEFRGRATQIRVWPLSFAEFFGAFGGSEKDALDEYMLYGGMPGLLTRSGDDAKKDYLKNLYDELYLRDIEERNRVESPEVLNEILDYLASQIGSLSNPTRLANAITAAGSGKQNPATVSKYIKYFMDSFLISEAKRYDIKGKSYFNFPFKYYYTDVGLRNVRLNYRQYDPGHIMENIVYNELLMRGYSVDVGVAVDRRNRQCVNREVDFVVNNRSERVYIQSALRMEDEEKIAAELDAFRLIGDFSRRVVIRNDIPHTFSDDSGIVHMRFSDFLLQRENLF